ncbi:hypothetical protein BU26DRAFT_607954 [Trematosphaeria pertusa]|uniref:Uncharacterized protein n=1 Tax=Trematosphaeria pertusa TaxID=390896 RepID=A0A6A6I629_9PLEO|nr:uncharacterized protein BU26DRAFT_607954 [Trematosphaeria pertusa]KAF2245777.1 hypothetical protein BU26DRAFT_607954 [Trematosphaeria pertusa]
MADIPPYPLYNRTYLLYRLSPLHTGDAPLLHERSLRTHAKRLREQLKGDSVRGVEVDFAAAEDALPRLGPLEECAWDMIGDEDAWIDRHRQLVDPDASQLSSVLAPEQARGIQVSLEYETQSYNALLLRDPRVASSPDGFTALPLLLVKMPAPVRDIFLNYLRTSFDAHVAPLRLPSAFIAASLETFFRHLSASTSTQSIQDVIRQLHVQLSFPNATALLRHVDITIAGRDVRGFVTRGDAGRGVQEKPFTAALSSYLRRHLALDMSHPKVHISRISCGSFVLGTDRLKLVAPDTLSDASFSEESNTPEASAGQLAIQDFFTALVREATGTGKFLPEDSASGIRSSTPSSTASNRAGRRKRAVSNTAAGNGHAKRSKARGKENGSRAADEEMADA